MKNIYEAAANEIYDRAKIDPNCRSVGLSTALSEKFPGQEKQADVMQLFERELRASELPPEMTKGDLNSILGFVRAYGNGWALYANLISLVGKGKIN